VATVVSDSNIASAHAQTFKNRSAVVHLVLEVHDLAQLNRQIARLEGLPYVLRVERLMSVERAAR
jgi:(p)ppGpp synthase/HD superfamily hydrolase